MEVLAEKLARMGQKEGSAAEEVHTDQFLGVDVGVAVAVEEIEC